jgi:hypothetical protein
MAVRNPTQWTPPSGAGYVVTIGNENLVTNSGSFLVDNLGKFLVTNTTNVTGKYTSAWTKTQKGKTNWINQTVTVGVLDNVVDQSGNFVIDQSGNFVVDSGTLTSGKNDTQWTASGV